MTQKVEGGNSLRERTFIFCEVTGGARCGILMTGIVGLSFLFASQLLCRMCSSGEGEDEKL
jgi:hypothetical protein